MRIVYFYLMRGDPERVGAAAAEHAEYWHRLRLPGYVGGPLADRSGGLITFEAGSIAEAEELASSDPFARAGVLDRAWIAEWNVQVTGPMEDLRPVG
jgi:uncharacterized protein